MHKPVAKVDSGIEQDAPPKGKFSIHSKCMLISRIPLEKIHTLLTKVMKWNPTFLIFQAIGKIRVGDIVIWLMALILKKGGLQYSAMLTKKEILFLAARKDPHYLVQLVSKNELKIVLA